MFDFKTFNLQGRLVTEICREILSHRKTKLYAGLYQIEPMTEDNWCFLTASTTGPAGHVFDIQTVSVEEIEAAMNKPTA